MNKIIKGSLKKGNIKLLEYETPEGMSPSFFLQSGVVGFLMTRKDLSDLSAIIRAYEDLCDLDEIEIL